MLTEARTTLLDGADPADLLAAMGFHLGLEFFAHEEFNLVDVHLRTHFPALVAALERGDGATGDGAGGDGAGGDGAGGDGAGGDGAGGDGAGGDGERGDGEDNDYLWLAIHTVVEIHHYRAGPEAVKAATRFCGLPEAHTLVPARVKAGFNAFVDLQQRYYEAILAD